MSGLTLFRRKNQSQALVQAPSMDLIRSDNELVVPEPEEIRCQMTLDEFEKYSSLFDQKEFRMSNFAFVEECFRQYLRSQGILEYDAKEVDEFLSRQLKIKRLANTSYQRLWRALAEETNDKETASYQQAIPVRIIQVVKSVKSFCRKQGLKNEIQVSDINDNNKYICHPSKSMIYFIKVNFLLSKAFSSFQNAFIIDAWRGPTFSDEEAKI